MTRQAKDPDTAEPPFPVLEEWPLAYLPRKILRPARRDLSELPTARPGTVLVFHHGVRHVVFEESRHLTGSEEPVVDATAVSLVDTRTHDFTAQLVLPSASPADDFVVRAVFRAWVTDPELAAREGPIKLARYLTNHLEKDRDLLKLGANYPVEKIAAIRDVIITRIEAYLEFYPVDLPGLQVELASAKVMTPHELRDHERQKRDVQRSQEIERLQTSGEDIRIDRHKKLVAEGPTALTAVGLSRGETSINEAIENARDDEARAQARFAEAFHILQQNGALDYLDFDPTEMVNAYLEKLTGQKIPPARRAELNAGPTAKANGMAVDGVLDGPMDDPIDAPMDGRDEDDEPPDEDDL